MDLDEYFETKIKKDHKCINCAKCLYPAGGKIIKYKYPDNVKSTNMGYQTYKYKIPNQRLSFNYDDFR